MTGLFMFLSMIVLCLFLFSIALLWVRVQDARLTATARHIQEQQQWEKYKHITEKEAIKDVGQLVHNAIRQEMDRQTLPVARYYKENDPPELEPAMINEDWVNHEARKKYEHFLHQNELKERSHLDYRGQRYR